MGISVHFGKANNETGESWEDLDKLNWAPGMCFYSANAWKAAYESERRFRERWLTEFARLSKQDSAGAAYPSLQTVEKIRQPQSRYCSLQHNNTVNHKRNENAVAGVGRLKFPVVKDLSRPKLRKLKMRLQLLRLQQSWKWGCSKVENVAAICHCTTATVGHLNEVIKNMQKTAINCFVKDKFGIFLD